MEQIEKQTSGVLPNEYLKQPLRKKVTLLSDSVAISLQYEDCHSQSEGYKHYLVWLICVTTIKVLDLFLQGEPHLALRGCITYGQYDVLETFIFGPAVDDAAENAEISQGAFVWLLPEAASMYRSCIETLTHHRDKSSLWELVKRTVAKEGLTAPEINELTREITNILNIPIIVDPYEVPLKTGQRIRCPVLNPFAFRSRKRDRTSVLEWYSAALLGNQIDVMLKRQHTMDFLELADKLCARN